MYTIINGEKVIINIIKSKRKSIGLEIRGDGSIVVRTPGFLSEYMICEFVEKHRNWIEEKRKHIIERNRNADRIRFPEYNSLSAEDKALIREKYLERVNHYSKIMGVEINRLTIRNQRTRWGSLSSRKNMNLNYRLYYMPQELLDYVVVHELSHVRHMNHSKEFWNEVGKYYPEYRRERKRLKDMI